MADDLRGAMRRPLGLGTHPLYPMLLPIPIICFAAVVLTDLAYLAEPEMMWVDFSSWLLVAGLVGGGLAGAVLVVELVRAPAARRAGLTIHLVLLLVAWVIELLNSFIHTRDGWTAVAGTGIIVTIIGALLALAAGWTWRSAADDRRVGEAA